MAKKNAFKDMSTKKKARKLFWGTLAPLLTVTIVACTFFYYISNVIIDYYLNAELSRQIEKVNSSVLEKNISPKHMILKKNSPIYQL